MFFRVTTHVRWRESGVLLRLQSLKSVTSSPGSLVPFPYSRLDWTHYKSGPLIPLRLLFCHRKQLFTSTATLIRHWLPIEMRQYRHCSPPHQVPGSSQGIIVYLPASRGEKRQRKSLFALFCIEWSHWNVRNVFSKGRPRTL